MLFFVSFFCHCLENNSFIIVFPLFMYDILRKNDRSNVWNFSIFFRRGKPQISGHEYFLLSFCLIICLSV